LYIENVFEEFCAQLSPKVLSSLRRSTTRSCAKGTKVLENILDIQVPMIAAINGAATAHSEYALLCDIVIAAEGAYFQDAPHPHSASCPATACNIVWPDVIGEIRGVTSCSAARN